MLALLLLLLSGPAWAGTAAEYETRFRRALTQDAGENAAVLALSVPQGRSLRQAQESRRQISRLSSLAIEGLSFNPGDLDAILSGLQQAAPDHAAAVGQQLSSSFPGYAPRILARLGRDSSATEAVTRQTWTAPRAAAPPPRPSRQASQAAATAIARIAGNPATLPEAVATARAAAPGEESTVIDALVQAYPGFQQQIHAAAGQAPLAVSAVPSAPRLTAASAPLATPSLAEEFDDDAEAPALPGGIGDPIEGFNRAVFAFNDVVDTALLRPIALGYTTITPDPVILAVRHFFLNLNSPVIFVNDVLQADFGDAGVTLGRFAVNSTVGVLGLFDPATSIGMERHRADFGQTLHSYGVDSGPYVVLPLLGPSSARDTVGAVADALTNPLFWLLDTTPNLILSGVKAVSVREELLQPLDELKASSVDYYSALKSAYVQNRRVELNKGRVPEGGDNYDQLFDATLNSEE